MTINYCKACQEPTFVILTPKGRRLEVNSKRESVWEKMPDNSWRLILGHKAHAPVCRKDATQ